MSRTISLVTPSETGPEAVINEIKAGVATALMGLKLPGAFSFEVPQYGASVNAKPTASAKDGKIMYNLSGSFVLGGQTWAIRGNIVPPKGAKLAIGGQDLTDYQTARTTLDKQRQARKGQVIDAADDEAAMEAGEST